jgi:hypothetical protein
VELDPAHPTLDHHRPGGLPLLGTAMGIELMVAAAENALGLGVVRQIEDVKVYEPHILQTDDLSVVHISLDMMPQTSSVPSCSARLFQPQSENCPEIAHFECRLLWEPPARALADVILPLRHTPSAVTHATVYDTFFHGPSFQVVGNAAFDGSGLLAQLANSIELNNLSNITRYIEFAMQSAGLLELALTGRMMVPHRLAHICLHAAELNGADVFAIVHQATELDSQTESSSDMVLIDATGRQIVSISGYDTVPLPFSVHPSQTTALADALHRSKA